jgi:hypothetical protein
VRELPELLPPEALAPDAPVPDEPPDDPDMPELPEVLPAYPLPADVLPDVPDDPAEPIALALLAEWIVSASPRSSAASASPILRTLLQPLAYFSIRQNTSFMR